VRLNKESFNRSSEGIFICDKAVASLYIDSLLAIGMYGEAREIAEDSEDSDLILKVSNALPVEILDVVFLEKYIDDNFPESSFGGRE